MAAKNNAGAGNSPRQRVSKTYKQYVGGAFVRSESGKVFPQRDPKGAFVANIPRASRKDLRDAVVAARKAFPGWQKRSAFNRSQVLFRVSEVLEDRRDLFEAALRQQLGRTAAEARNELNQAVDRIFWYSGWCDKFAQALGSINPVAAPFFNFSLPEPVGVVVQIASDNSPLLGMISGAFPIILSGNTTVVVVGGEAPTLALDFTEVLNASDVPGGVVNVLTGRREEVTHTAASHMDVNALACFGNDAGEREALGKLCADNVKRFHWFEDPDAKKWLSADQQSLYWIDRFVEWKTAWHPMGI